MQATIARALAFREERTTDERRKEREKCENTPSYNNAKACAYTYTDCAARIGGRAQLVFMVSYTHAQIIN